MADHCPVLVKESMLWKWREAQYFFIFLTAGYYCLSDSQFSDILHIDFQLDPADDTVNHVYAYQSSDDTPLSGCRSEYDSTNEIHHLRITINTTTQQQVSPSSSCGSSFVSLLDNHDLYSIIFHVMTKVKFYIIFAVLLLISWPSSNYLWYFQYQVIHGIYGISVSQMTTDMFHLPLTRPCPFHIHDLSPDV